MTVLLLCWTNAPYSQAYMLANTLADISLQFDYPSNTMINARLIDHAFFPRPSIKSLRPIQTGILVEGILRRNTYQVNMETRGLNSEKTISTLRNKDDPLESELRGIFGEAIQHGRPEESLLESSRNGWSNLAARGPFNTPETYARLVNVCRWYQRVMDPQELQRRCHLLTVMSARGKKPVWWRKEDMYMLWSRGLNWEVVIKIGDSLKLWEAKNRRWSAAELNEARRVLLLILSRRTNANQQTIPWDISAEKGWLQIFCLSPSDGPNPPRTSHTSRLSANCHTSTYSQRFNMLVGNVKSSFRQPLSDENLERGTWINDGLRLEFLSKGFDPNLMVKLRIALEAPKIPHTSQSTLTEGAQLLYKYIGMEPNDPNTAVRRWFGEAIEPGIFESRLRLTMQRLLAAKVHSVPVKSDPTQWKAKWARFLAEFYTTANIS
ncbi:uncharacterized protein MELLADRAFT_93339 [Melampsora larici-populina 98AG31]|uniref:Uncharacterized protein n=1 Tax=Melampsora larici-populina (strain 98AG31 / pathotype 3-4-7) TaxID=747676 RepID=F4S4U1_MELLP|nr:uncharacterized protein MELLADRAFT_93339 [Melampsora larici-populina 98AG31]EGG00368.1 hypothetical protein MELLADRAFT_93339 [Melampsora larici-populina 98AG31]